MTVVAGVTLGKSLNSYERGSDYGRIEADDKGVQGFAYLCIPPENKHDEAGNEVQEVQH